MDEIKTREVEENDGPKKYEIESWADTVLKAHEIMADAEKMKLVQPMLDNKKKAIQNLPVSNMSELKMKIKKVNEQEDEE